MTDPRWNRIHRRAYRDGWTDTPPPDSTARGIILGCFIGLCFWTSAIMVGLWWWP